MNLDLHLLEGVPVMVLSHLENTTTVSPILLETAFVVVEAAAAVTTGAAID